MINGILGINGIRGINGIGSNLPTDKLKVIVDGASVNSKATVSNITVEVALAYIGNNASGRSTTGPNTRVFTLNNYSKFTYMEVDYQYYVAYSYGAGWIKWNGSVIQQYSHYGWKTAKRIVPISEYVNIQCYAKSNIGYACSARFKLKNVTLHKENPAT